ncbi:hypothetical protein Q1695_006801 [Nippostrongylus brasiliensis]|nr:hypothetical protein Q1695_006801 [Nippostrongylus brasiliensis]
MATKGIVWRTITPYAPWQGAFYERLIKTVKHSLYKVIRRETIAVETLETLLIEVEGTVNSRPLTYQEEHWQDTPILRPIDFVQRDMIITYPFESITGDIQDADYHPAGEEVQLRTRKQAEEALRSSHRLTERFWRIWSEHYLRSLREVHKLSIDTKRGSSIPPALGNVVLISDPLIPRNSWKLGRIVELKGSESGNVREAQVKLPSGRVIRRPINHLIPLELEETAEEKIPSPDEVTEHIDEIEEQADTSPRYDLRPRKPVNYQETPMYPSDVYSAITTRTPLGLLITCLTTFMLMSQTALAIKARGEMQCIPGGVAITSENIERYELCAEGYCRVSEDPQGNETILLPPEILLHDHHVQLKLFDGKDLTVVETTCSAVSFCDHVRCWFCTANVLNPECAPRAAIIAIAVTLYVVVALLYVLCYVPLVIGKPCRIIGKAVWIVCKALRYLLWRLLRGNRRRRYDIEALLNAPLLAVGFVILAAFVSNSLSCQNIDVFSHRHSRCSFSPKGTKRCTLETTEVMKLNSFNQDACIRLLHRRSLQKELRIQWKRLQLKCVKGDSVFTRNTIQRVVDSKRCSHSGSCTNDKCVNISASSLIPELERGNHYPGITRCVESCGGPGCGCFYLSSGCLFYRIFHVPTDTRIYEMFKCPQWREELELEVNLITQQGKPAKSAVTLQPTVPVNLDGMRITLSALSVPPTPALSSTFISDGSNLAIWNSDKNAHLLCESESDAKSLNCSVTTACNCEPAENKVICLCNDVNITKIFSENIENRFPIRRPWITFTASKDDPTTTVAEIPSFTTAELIVHLRDQFDKTVTVVTDSVCTISNSIARGCYHCSQGATAEVSCTTNGNDTMATVQCEDLVFTIPCHQKGAISSLRFSHTSARVRKTCKVSCGTTETTFEITGILQWVRTIHGSTLKVISGESSVFDELVFPDFGHIVSVCLSWYKTVIVVFVTLIIAFAVGYVLFWTCGINVLLCIVRFTFCIITNMLHLATCTLRSFWKILFSRIRGHKRTEKLL